jgi:hypothetical protein
VLKIPFCGIAFFLKSDEHFGQGNMKKILLLLVLIVVGGQVYAAADCSVDLNGDGKCDSYEVSDQGDEGLSTLSIEIGGTSKQSKGTFNFGQGGLIAGYFSTDFQLMLDYNTRDVDVKSYTFRWNGQVQDWILDRTADWQEPDRDESYSLEQNPVTAEKLLPENFDVHRVACCTKLDGFNDKSKILNLSDEDTKLAIKRDFVSIKNSLLEGGSSALLYDHNAAGDKAVRTIPPEFVYELSTVIDAHNVVDINNFAYYMYQNSMFVPAVMLLRSIHEKYPDRVVAILNLADASWALGMKKEACTFYAEYSQKMIKAAKGAKIPSYALSRQSCS